MSDQYEKTQLSQQADRKIVCVVCIFINIAPTYHHNLRDQISVASKLPVVS